MICLLLFLTFLSAKGSDYWNENFDQSKNCLPSFKEQGLCEKAILIKDERKALFDCKQKLTRSLIQNCSNTTIEKAGSLLYCMVADPTPDRSSIRCCITNHTCAPSWANIRERYPRTALAYLKNKDQFLNDLVALEGYKSCHPIQGLNVSQCYEDCKSYTGSPLQKECESRGGLFKCCIRRDKANCHECRYCCTLPFCTWLSLNVKFYGTEIDFQLATRHKADVIQAVNTLNAYHIFYQNTDSRCLVPNESTVSSEWDHYVPEDFADAQTDLSQAGISKFDNRFFNFEDPQVMEAMTGRHYQQNWKETYGFDFVSKTRKVESGLRDILQCAKYCMKEEKRKFATDCKKNGGFFKCCINSWDLELFENTHKILEEEHYLNESIHFCQRNGDDTNHCHLCTATYLCTFKNDMGEARQEYKSENPNPVGGKTILDSVLEYDRKAKKFQRSTVAKPFQRVGFRLSFCIRLDFCMTHEEVYNVEPFLLTTTKEEFCALRSSNIEANIEQKYKPEHQKECLRRRSQVRICPNNIIKTLNDSVIFYINSHLIQLNEKLIQSEKKRKKKEKKKEKRRKKNKDKDNS